MANVEGWEVGTYYGEPIYKTVPQEKFVDPVVQEFYAHGHEKHYKTGTFLNMWV